MCYIVLNENADMIKYSTKNNSRIYLLKSIAEEMSSVKPDDCIGHCQWEYFVEIEK